jgi:hypothetical protein
VSQTCLRRRLECLRCVKLAPMPSGLSQARWVHLHIVWSVPFVLDLHSRVWVISGTLDSPSRPQMHWTRLHPLWSISGALDTPSRCPECPRRVGLASTPSVVLGTRWTRHYAVWIIYGTFDSPSHRLERPRRVGLALMLSGWSRAHWARLHAVWVVQMHWTCLHAVRSVLDVDSRCLEHPRRVELALTLFGASQLRRWTCIVLDVFKLSSLS